MDFSKLGIDDLELYHGQFTGQEIDDLLNRVKNNNVGSGDGASYFIDEPTTTITSPTQYSRLISVHHNDPDAILYYKYNFEDVTWTAYSSPILFDSGGTHTIFFRAIKDNNYRSDIIMRKIVLEDEPAVAPVITLDDYKPNASSPLLIYGKTITISLSKAQNGATLKYNLDGAGWEDYTTPFNIITGGQHTIEAMTCFHDRRSQTSKIFNITVNEIIALREYQDPTYTISIPNISAAGGTSTITINNLNQKVTKYYTDNSVTESVDVDNISDAVYSYIIDDVIMTGTTLSDNIISYSTDTSSKADVALCSIKIGITSNGKTTEQTVTAYQSAATQLTRPINPSVTYNRSNHTIVETNAGYTITGTNTGKSVGTYSVKVKPNTGYIWSTGSVKEQITVTMTINKANNPAIIKAESNLYFDFNQKTLTSATYASSTIKTDYETNDGGVIHYKVGSAATTTDPTTAQRINNGTYTVYYYADETNNYKKGTGSVQVTIADSFWYGTNITNTLPMDLSIETGRSTISSSKTLSKTWEVSNLTGVKMIWMAVRTSSIDTGYTADPTYKNGWKWIEGTDPAYGLTWTILGDFTIASLDGSSFGVKETLMCKIK